MNSYSLPQPSGDRIKPPPSAVNYENKVIRLGGSGKLSSKLDSLSISQKDNKPTTIKLVSSSSHEQSLAIKIKDTSSQSDKSFDMKKTKVVPATKVSEPKRVTKIRLKRPGIPEQSVTTASPQTEMEIEKDTSPVIDKEEKEEVIHKMSFINIT